MSHTELLTKFLALPGRIAIISACSAGKARSDLNPNAYLSADELDDPLQRVHGERRLANYMLPAAEMYTGQGHRYVRSSVALLRTHGFPVMHYILSAGYGLLHEQTLIAPYDVTFSGKSATWITARGRQLGIAQQLQELAHEKERLLIILGRQYLISIRIFRLNIRA